MHFSFVGDALYTNWDFDEAKLHGNMYEDMTAGQEGAMVVWHLGGEPWMLMFPSAVAGRSEL